MKTLTAKQQAVFDMLVAAGERGLTHKEFGIRRGYNPLPALIFGRYAEHIKDTEPPRYRAIVGSGSTRPLPPTLALS